MFSTNNLLFRARFERVYWDEFRVPGREPVPVPGVAVRVRAGHGVSPEPGQDWEAGTARRRRRRWRGQQREWRPGGAGSGCGTAGEDHSNTVRDQEHGRAGPGDESPAGILQQQEPAVLQEDGVSGQLYSPESDRCCCRDGLGSGPNTFDPSEFPSLGQGGGGGGLAGRPNYGKLGRTQSRHLDIGGRCSTDTNTVLYWLLTLSLVGQRPSNVVTVISLIPF